MIAVLSKRRRKGTIKIVSGADANEEIVAPEGQEILRGETAAS
jgi:hypothetical protein